MDGDGGSSSGDWETDSAADSMGSDSEAGGMVAEAAAASSSAPGSAAAAAAAHGQGSGGAVTASSAPQQPGQEEQEALDPTYLQLFLLKYICPKRRCFGHMAPTEPGSDVCECNVCGSRRSEAQFLAELDS